MEYKRIETTNYYVLFTFICLIAALLRFSGLTLRPMHTDEAVHALKFSSLLEEGYYRYDKHEYHGPTLNYFTLLPAWIKNQETLKSLNESTIRIIPAIFGTGLVLLLLLLKNGFGKPLILVIASLTAISSPMVFYSRYYIQETLLVCFTFGSVISIYRYIATRKSGWLILTGAFLGLMHASKETCLINLGMLLLAFIITLFIRFRKYQQIKSYLASFRLWHVMIIVVTAVIVSGLFYSSFLSNPAGIADSYATYKTYFNRAGMNEFHIHPWYYYLRLLIFSKSPSGMIWSEIWILLPACYGCYSLIKKPDQNQIHYYLILFLGIYTVLLAVIYSFIPYKTPWNMLGFYHGLIILAGYGIIRFYNLETKKWISILIIIIFSIGALHMVWQSYVTNYKNYSDPFNPYVYAHTSEDIYKVTLKIDSVAMSCPEGKDILIEVIFPAHDYWPLPWYLRKYTNTGWWDSVDFQLPAAPIILASPEVEKDLIRKLYKIPPPGERYLYVPLFNQYLEIRPMIEIRGYIRKDVWDHYHQYKTRI